MMFKSVELFYEPRERCIQENDWPQSEPEMTPFESAFLCGLIKEKKPRKIVEIGVAGGGTTAIILKCIELLGMENQCEMYSIDISEEFYRGKGERTGYLACKTLNNGKTIFNHSFVLGKLLPEVIDKIGEGIDFVILDTEHSVPGEILDFLAIYPYLCTDACVVLHDLALNHLGRNREAFVTQLLLSCVKANKYLITDKQYFDRPLLYPNIGAFDINDETGNHIEDVFLSLMITWRKAKTKEVFSKYKECFRYHYGEELASLFETIYQIQVNTSLLRKKERPSKIRRQFWHYFKKNALKVFKKQ